MSTSLPLLVRQFLVIGAGVAVAFFFVLIASAWTAPTATAPNGNTPAPVNVGTDNQVKDGGLGVNSLAVFGNVALSGTARYLNFGVSPSAPSGSSGYGIRDNGGTLQYKNNGGSWTSFDGGTSGGSGSGSMRVQTVSSTYGNDGDFYMRSVAICPAGTLRVGCSGARQGDLRDTCEEESCGIIGILPSTEPNGCAVAVDGDNTERAVAIAYCLTP